MNAASAAGYVVEPYTNTKRRLVKKKNEKNNRRGINGNVPDVPCRSDPSFSGDYLKSHRALLDARDAAGGAWLRPRARLRRGARERCGP